MRLTDIRYPAAALFVALSLTACGPENKAPASAIPIDVTTVVTKPTSLPASFTFVGQTQSPQAVDIRARVSGFLIKRNYTEGSIVTAGQLLFEIDHAPFLADLASAKAEFLAQKARYERAKANLDRVLPLAAENALSPKDRDDAIGSAKAAEASMQAAQAQVQTQELNLSYTYVRSPVDGVSDYARVNDGSYVNTENSLLTTVSTLNPMRVVLSVSEDQFLAIRALHDSGRMSMPQDGRMQASLLMADGTTYPQAGVVTFASTTFSQQTGTFMVRADFANAESALRPGQFVRVTLTGANYLNAIQLPQRAVMHGPKGDFVFVVGKDNKAEVRPVQVADPSGEFWRVESGLKGGEQVVVDGAGKTTSGAPLKVTGDAPIGSFGAVKATAE
ncbi:efflux RND transporter periplasmic adaptor subunit [Pseudomonas nicosulfuronedens]|uniref:Efflux RND transporter periplasmic adaptor subunit n=1 Tax=Pseudomonas nicosulfuronedens TaxID=2571105 RepID=A0A5R9R702_9PSED|nr:efflux RND transporter periplasmic adaptor subunit [Pseudomonas nicosulfuronedens]TLX78636.1 efflux RND transporter periplasmic adaptor subunit [Pseudomonas nicosulfuronedens]